MDVRLDMCTDMRADMCIGTRLDVSIDKRLGMRACMYTCVLTPVFACIAHRWKARAKTVLTR